MRAVNLTDVRTEGGELLDGGVEGRKDARLIALPASQLFHHPDPHTREVPRGAFPGRSHHLRTRREQRRRVARVVSGDHLVQQCGVEHRARTRATLIQR